MKALQNDDFKGRKIIKSRVAMLVLGALIITFLTGLIVGKSYAAGEKIMQHDGAIIVQTPTLPNLEEQKDVVEPSIEHSSSNTNINNQNSIENTEVPITHDKVQTEMQTNSEENNLGKVVYLTFDDGPSKLTDQFLDLLKEQDVKATFFMQGDHLKKEYLQASVRRATTEGHYVGGHSMTHEFIKLYNEKQFVPEMNETLALIHEITGTNPNLVRPPYGSAPGLKSEQIRNQIVEADIKVWDWTIDSNDWSLKDNPTQIIENIKSGTKSNKEVVLMHERPQTLLALPGIIKFFKEQGYQFVVYDEANHFDLNFQNDSRL